LHGAAHFPSLLMMKPPPDPAEPVPDPATQAIEDLLRDAPAVPPSPGLWDRIEAALPPPPTAPAPAPTARPDTDIF
jgi:hypothetical protein